jgi:[protein-PII] uridylyltransferase
VSGRARLVDEVLLRAWRHHLDQPQGLSLLAVGGYGRGELHPASDIDVMVLTPDSGSDPWRKQLEGFFTFLWDIGLEVGQSVRSIAQCEQEAAADVTVATTLMEARLLTGSDDDLKQMLERTGPDRIWPSDEFFRAKRKEQLQRHHRYHDTAYNLEPNVKGGPGGLRDIQIIGWVAKRHFGAETLDELVSHGFLTRKELRRLRGGQAFLWTVRFALHVFTGRREDRLLFDHQTRIAQFLNYEDASNSLAVEQFMQRYYRTVKELSRLNEMLLQLFEEAILLDPTAPPSPINSRFQVRNGYLEIRYEDVFLESPSALLELFSLLQQHPDLKGASANTIRELRDALSSVDEEFRQSPRNHRLFMDILRAPLGVTHELRRMNLYGVIGRYIPAFERVVGRMQYDLFHAYTVDEHTMFVVSNLRRFALQRFDHEFPVCSQIMQALPKPELAYLAGLFHDIGKGRGGDHSELGSAIAEAFCLEQGLSRYEARLVAWLVSKHLLLSTTSQKKDISDPAVIHEFALTVGDQVHLDYLYLLTVADVRGTNPKLWNSWKANLFEELYKRTKVVLRRGLENPIDREELIADHKQQALALLANSPARKSDLEQVWDGFNDDYFLTNSPEEISWHTQLLAEHQEAQGKIRVAVRDMPQRGGISVVVYAPSQVITFAPVTGAMDDLGLSIHDARLAPAGSGYTLSSYVVLEQSGTFDENEERLEEIRSGVQDAIERFDIDAPRVSRRVPRQVRMFSTPTRVEFSDDKAHARTVMELVTGDRPGLASRVGRVMLSLGIRLINAKISTVGERAEDVFFLCDKKQRPLTLDLREQLKTRLLEELDDTPAARR